MLIRPAYTKDINEIVSMYKELIKSIYPTRTLGSDYHFYKVVIDWIDKGYQLIVTEKNNIVTGFYLAFIDDMGGLTQAVYHCAEIYIKPEYRKSRAFYLLLNNLIMTAEDKKMILVADTVPSLHAVCKKIGSVPTLTKFEKGL